MTTTAVRTDASSSARRLGKLVRPLVVTGLLATTVAVSQTALAALDNFGIANDDPLAQGDALINGLFVGGANFSGNITAFSLGFASLGTTNKLALRDDNAETGEQIAIAFTPAPTNLRNLSLLFHGDAINGEAAANATPPDTFFVLSGSGNNRTVDVTSPFPDMVLVDIAFTTSTGVSGIEGGTAIGFGSTGGGSQPVNLFTWDDLTHETGGTFDLFIGTNGALEDLPAELNAVPIPPAAWLLGSAVFALVGMRRGARRK